MIKLKIRIPKYRTDKEANNFFKKIGIKDLDNFFSSDKPKIKKKIEKKTYKPNMIDLASLYEIIILHKRTTVLEFGSGWSSLVIAHALKFLKKKYSTKIKKIRRSNPFELFILENERKYLSITKKRLKNFKGVKINYFLSEVVMTNYNGKIATKYSNLPMCNPDFIYLDGPDQFRVKKSKNSFSTSHPDLMPMASDILKIEYFLIPGTIILVDGRGANVNFLKNNFQRKWKYVRLDKTDQHMFVLIDKPLGNINKNQIKYYNSN